MKTKSYKLSDKTYCPLIAVYVQNTSEIKLDTHKPVSTQ